MEECSHCRRFSLKVLRHRLALQVNLSGGNPMIASTAAVAGAGPAVTLLRKDQHSTS